MMVQRVLAGKTVAEEKFLETVVFCRSRLLV